MKKQMKMSRGLERKLMITGSVWNLITSLLTIFSYYSWFDRQGAERLENVEMNLAVSGSQMVNNVLQVILIFGIFIFIGAIINFIIAVKMQDNEIQKKVFIWIGCWAAVQLACMDIIGFVLYLLAFVLYISRNKAIKLMKTVSTE